MGHVQAVPSHGAPPSASQALAVLGYWPCFWVGEALKCLWLCPGVSLDGLDGDEASGSWDCVVRCCSRPQPLSFPCLPYCPKPWICYDGRAGLTRSRQRVLVWPCCAALGKYLPLSELQVLIYKMMGSVRGSQVLFSWKILGSELGV